MTNYEYYADGVIGKVVNAVTDVALTVGNLQSQVVTEFSKILLYESYLSDWLITTLE